METKLTPGAKETELREEEHGTNVTGLTLSGSSGAAWSPDIGPYRTRVPSGAGEGQVERRQCAPLEPDPADA